MQRIPKVRIFIPVATKKVMKNAGRHTKMAIFLLVTRNNGRVMTQGVLFIHG